MTWQGYAVLAALAGGATAVLAKMGVEAVPPNLAMAVRTAVVMCLAWAIVLVRGEQSAWSGISGRSLMYLILSGFATGLSWLAYFHALRLGPASRVAPIDKLSLAFTIILAALLLGETITWRLALGAALMIAGSLLTLRG